MPRFDDVDKAIASARKRISEAGFSDLASFKVRRFNRSANWAGQYSRGSVDRPVGAIVLLNVRTHKDADQIIETLLHEVGHALWELLDPESRKEWLSEIKNLDDDYAEEHGAEECFADDFMYFCLGRQNLMRLENCFRSITAAPETSDE